MVPVYPAGPVKKPIDIAGRVRRALSARGLTIYQISQQSAEIFGRSSPYYIPQQFYAALAVRAASPSIYQFIALSRITKYRLTDWLAMFGFELDDIPRLQLLFPWRRTVFLDSSVYDEDQWIPWFVDRARTSELPAITPLGQLLKQTEPRRAGSLLALNTRRFLYVKVGKEDAFAFPDLVPGSIARIDVLNAGQLASGLGQSLSNRIFLVERGSHLACGHLRRINGNRLALCSTSFPYPQLELTLGRTARIIGMVDAEIHPMALQLPSSTPARTRAHAKTNAAATPDATTKLGQMIQISRMRTGLSFREASAMSRWVAKMLGDNAYFISPGTLCDYDDLSDPPRNIQKIVCLCILYCIGFWDFLRAAGLTLDLGSEPMSDELRGRTDVPPPQPPDGESAGAAGPSKDNADFLSARMGQWKEIPLFIRGALPEISGLQNLSLSDIFWVGAERDPIHPHLVNAEFVTVNRRFKKPMNSLPPPREQPVYMILKRDGGFLCGCCTQQQGTLSVHRHPQHRPAPAETERDVDAEVIGQVTAILRRFS